MAYGLLVDESPLQVSPSLAQLIGLNESIVLNQIHYWINPKHNKNILDDHYWVYNTYKQWKQQFPFWSISTIQRIIYNLEKDGLIISYIPKSVADSNRLKYYTINYKILDKMLRAANAENKAQSIVEPHIVNIIGGSPHFDETSPHFDETSPHFDETGLLNLMRPLIDTEITYREYTEKSSVLEKNALPDDQEIKKVKKKKGSSLNDDWSLPADWRNWSVEHGMSHEEIDLSELKFKNYWLSTTKNPIKANWFMTWQNWCVRECEQKGIRFKVKLVPAAATDSAHIPKISSDAKIQKWYDLQSQLSKQVGENEYASWLSDLEIVSIADEAVFEVKSKFVREWISKQFLGEICSCLGKIDPRLTSEGAVKFILKPTDGTLE